MAGGAHARPVVLALEGDGRRHGQVRRRVVGPGPLEVVDEERRPRALAAVAPADDERLQEVLALRPGEEEAGALGGGEPLVAVAGVEVRPELIQLEVHVAGRVRPVDHRQDAGGPRASADLGDWEDEGGARGDVADGDHPRASGHAGPELLDERLRALDRQVDRLVDVTRALALAVVAPGAVDRAVLEVGGEHLVAGLEPQRARDRVDAGGGVGHEDDVLRVGADEAGERAARLGQQPLQASAQELDRLLLQLALPGLVGLEDRPRAGAEAAVVEEGDVPAEQVLVGQRGELGRGRHGRRG